MNNEMIAWIDKELSEISSMQAFKKYFKNVELEKIEKSNYLTNKTEGIGLVMNNYFFIEAIHFYAGKSDLVEKSYTGELLFNLKFSFSRDQIHKMFGIPKRSGGGHRTLYLGYIILWDKYYFDDYSLHLQYSVDNSSISLITLITLQLEDYLNSDLQ